MYNMSKIMTRAWKNFRKGGMSFSEALHRAWLSTKAEPINAQRIADAKATANISEDVQTWAGWKYIVTGGISSWLCLAVFPRLSSRPRKS